VGSTSFAETDSTYLDAVDGKITFSGGLIFSDGGGVVDPSPVPPQTPELVGRLTGGGSSTADTSINGAFFLSGNSYDVTSRVITASDATHFVTTGSLQLDNLTGDAFDLIRWGGDGLGFRTATDFWGEGSGRVVLLRGSLCSATVVHPQSCAFRFSVIPCQCHLSGREYVGNNNGIKLRSGVGRVMEWFGANHCICQLRRSSGGNSGVRSRHRQDSQDSGEQSSSWRWQVRSLSFYS